MVVLKSLQEGYLLITNEGMVHWCDESAYFTGESPSAFPMDHPNTNISVSQDDDDSTKISLSVKETTSAGIVRIVWNVTLTRSDAPMAMVPHLVTVALAFQHELTSHKAKLSGMKDWEATAKKLDGLFQNEKGTLLRNFCEFYKQSQDHAIRKLAIVRTELAKTKEELAAANMLLAPDDTELFPSVMVDQLAAGERVQAPAKKKAAIKPKAAAKSKAGSKPKAVAKPKKAAPKEIFEEEPTVRNKRKQPPPEPLSDQGAPQNESSKKSEPKIGDVTKPTKGFAAWLDSSDDDDDDKAPPVVAPKRNFFAKPIDQTKKPPPDDSDDEDITSLKHRTTSNTAPTKDPTEDADLIDKNLEDDILAQLEAMEE